MSVNLLQFLYDTWYAYLTPDREFPAEVRRILNTAFGQASRAEGCRACSEIMHDKGQWLCGTRCMVCGLTIAPHHRLAVQLALRARRLDLRAVMNDLCELVMEQVGAGLGCAAAARMVHARELRPCCCLSPRRQPHSSAGIHPGTCDACSSPLRQLELYRDTRESIALATQNPDCLRDMSPAARDRALQREMRAEGNLHPALQTPDGHYKVCGRHMRTVL